MINRDPCNRAGKSGAGVSSAGGDYVGHSCVYKGHDGWFGVVLSPACGTKVKSSAVVSVSATEYGRQWCQGQCGNVR
eukprot:2982556-Amphidinium_carterae.1